MSRLFAKYGTVLIIVSAIVVSSVSAETVELINGDVVHGKVLSLDAKMLKLQSESFGELTIKRDRIASIHLVRRKPASPSGRAKTKDASASILDRAPSPDDVLKQLRADGGISAQDMKAVQQKMPLLAVPEVQNYVSERLGGLLTGRLNVMDIRKEAIDAVDQIKDIQKDLGPQAGALNGYLSILENFIDETAPKSNSPATDGQDKDVNQKDP